MTERTKKNKDDQDQVEERRTGPGQGDTQERSTRSGSSGNVHDNRLDDDDDDRDTGTNRGDDDTMRRSTTNPQKKK